MGIPATTGQLRTKVSEMEIGDYIDFSFYTGSLLVNKLGKSDDVEIPFSGNNSGSGLNQKAYFIKVAKGLLVADRVCVHNYSWDTLNNSKVIQGKPFDTGNIIPTMTSNTSPSGVASASGYFNDNLAPWKAFDNLNNNQGWGTPSGVTTGWLSYELISPKIVSCYHLQAVSSSAGDIAGTPKSWTFEGWDGNQWIILDEKLNEIGWTSGELRKYEFINKKTYLKYRINVTRNNGGPIIMIGELKMFETVGTIRSLTGGVAYADANGNKSTTDLGFGAFPTNNEWDKYIVNFPSELITNGKTLNDVFHWSGADTWCQETPMLSIGDSNYRVKRTKGKIDGFNGNYASNLSGNTYGFRPVFHFKE
jgi:hypothetical protein